MSKIKVCDYIAHFLAAQKTSHIFEVAGGMITHMLDSIFKVGQTKIVSMHHEQSTAFAADAYGRCTRRPGIAMATSGPGATNLLTGIGSCYFDSSPALFITGQVNTHEQKRDRGIRQLGFQETDIVSMAKPITKKSYLIENPLDIPSLLHEAYQISINDRQGPVLLDIPMDIQSSYIEDEPITYLEAKTSKQLPSKDQLQALIAAIKKSKKPLILAGQGISCAQAKSEFKQFVDKTHIPVVTSLLGFDCLPYEHNLRVGFIGSYGNRWANLAIGAADLLIVIGSRLDIRQTGADVAGFRQNKMIFHVDCDAAEINNRVTECTPIISDVKNFLQCASDSIDLGDKNLWPSWFGEINDLKNAWPDTEELKNIVGINPNELMHCLSPYAFRQAAFIADVGNHQMWSAQSLELVQNQAYITSGGMGAMGFALPAAIGYCLAAGIKPVTVIVGDGAFQMNIQELQTIRRNNLPIKIIVLNNQALGMIRQFQDSYFEGRYQSTYWGYNAPDFVEISQAYGIAAKGICLSEESRVAMEWLYQSDSPMLLEVAIDTYTNVYPKIAFGKPITEMEPFSKPISMEGT